MPLTSCPECHGKLSTEAEMCPHCGHPAKLVTRPMNDLAHEPQCYKCGRTATTRCVKCGALSCALHLQNIRAGKRGYELRCDACYKDLQAKQTVGAIVGFVFLLIVVLLLLTMWSMRAFPGAPFGRGL